MELRYDALPPPSDRKFDGELRANHLWSGTETFVFLGEAVFVSASRLVPGSFLLCQVLRPRVLAISPAASQSSVFLLVPTGDGGRTSG
jgi:hypothetical protein